MTASAIADALRELQSPYLTAEAAAVYLGYAVRTFREKVAVKPDFPAPRFFGGTAMRWLRSDLDRWAEQQPTRRRGA